MRAIRQRLSGTAPDRSYLPGLDGLRAIAVLAVLLFHGGVATFGGGFLGVEVFFVVSGYLITLLLLREHAQSGRVDLFSFWGRRARRLLPAAAGVVALTLLYALVFLPDEVTGLRSDALSAAGYVTNWWLVFGNQPYFETMGRPSLLQHLWSLAVEEQFYLLWPAILWAGLKVGGRRGMFAASILGAAASYALMGFLYDPGTDPARVYYGTDTRAGGLLAGAALAFAWEPANVRAVLSKRLAASVAAAGVVAVAALVTAFAALDSNSAWLYPWGFAAIAAATCLAIVAATHPASKALHATLGASPMRWAGTRSYGLYLWHWPIFMVTRPGLDMRLDGLDLLLLRLVLVAAVAEISYRLIEQPFRTGAAKRFLRRSFQRSPVRARVLSAGGGFAALALVFTAFTAHPAATPAYLAGGGFQGVVGAPVLPPDDAANGLDPDVAPTLELPPTAEPTPPSEPTAAPTAEAPAEPVPPTPPPPAQPTPAPVPPAPTPAPPPPSNATVLAIGDSVLMGAVPYLGILGAVEVDALIGRQAGDVLRLVRERAAAGTLPPTVVIHTGNNGPLTVNTADAIVEAANGAKVVFVTVRVGRAWEDTTNDTVRQMPGRYANARVADWHEASAGHDECFQGDGVHLRREGGELFATIVAWAVQ